MTKLKKRILVFIAIMITACITLSLGIFLSRLTRRARAVVNVTSTNQGTVSLDELCVRHNIQYIYVPGGANGDYMKNHPELSALYTADYIRDSYNELQYTNSNRTVLQGWNTSGTDWETQVKQTTQRSMLVVPKSVTTITIDVNHYSFRGAGNSTQVNANQSFVGMAFEEGSLLTNISDNSFYSCDNLRFCILPQRNVGSDGTVIEKTITIGKSAFASTNSLMDLVLPEGVTSIGANAFELCANIQHLSIPSTVTTVSENAFKSTYALCDVEIKSAKAVASQFPYAMNVYGSAVESASASAKSYLYLAENGLDANGYPIYLAFCYNTLRSGTLATISGASQSYQKNYWYFITLAGLEDKSVGGAEGIVQTQYIFPEDLDLTAVRPTVKWDYLNSEGEKILNDYSGSDSVTKYDVNAYACYNLYFSHCILSGANKESASIQVLGDSAFTNSHVSHADIPASVTYIGANAFRGVGVEVGQVYYFRKAANADLYVGADAFVMRYSWVSTKVTTAERYIVFNSYEVYASENTTSSSKYQDSGEGKVIYTYLVPIKMNVYDAATGETSVEIDSYRLAGKSYNYTMNANERWSEKMGTDVPSLPNLAENASTVWYTDGGYGTAISVSDINSRLSSITVGEINLYTKRFGEPDTEIQTYVYDPNKEYTAATAIGISDDYIAEIVKYTDPVNNVYLSNLPSSVKDAGVYTVSVQISERWGSWAQSNYSYEVTVSQATIELSDIANLPRFTAINELGGEGTTLYQYSDGWYSYERTDAVSINTQTVTNSYVRYSGDPFTIGTAGGLSTYTVTRGTAGTTSAKDSGEYFGTFNFEINGYNYKFVNEKLAENREVLAPYGITVETIGENGHAASIVKRWYIVVQSNWLVDSMDSDGGTFVLTTLESEATTSWEYESDGVTVHIPTLANGAGSTDILFTLTFGNEVIAENVLVDDLPRYINPAMPAGTYTVLITAEAVTVDGASYPAIRERTILTVTPKAMDTADIEAFLTGQTFEKQESSSIFIHDDISALVAALNATLNTVRNGLTDDDNIWKSSEYDRFYRDVVVSYNLDRMQTSNYSTYVQMQIPKEVGEYNVYYSLSALNYRTLGGADAADRRNYTFNTIIYRVLGTSAFAEVGNDVVYTGGDVRPSVPYSQYYTYVYNDGNYVEARNGCTVTITLIDGTLSRWSTSGVPSNVTLDGNEVTVTFDIRPAANSWQVLPQISAWTYDGFDSEVHVVVSSLRFAGTEETPLQVYYRIGTLEDGVFSWVDLGKEGLTYNGESNYFTVDENGMVNAAIAAILNGLKPDTYYLASYAAAYPVNDYGLSNVESLTTPTSSYIRIVIGKAANRWTTSPNVVHWNWGEYSATVNTIAGTPLYLNVLQDQDLQVKFTVLDENKRAIEGLIGFTVVNGIVDEDVAIALAALHANVNGTYYLLATVEDTDYYVGLNTYALPDGVDEVSEGFDFSGYDLNLAPFDVAKANNHWEKSPTMTGWQFQTFTSSTNFVAGDPLYIKEGAQVVYFVYQSDSMPDVGQELTASDRSFTDIEAVEEYLRNATVGQYWFAAYAEGTDDFTALTLTVPFTVSQNAVNLWETIPTVTGWVYDAATVNQITEGIASFGTAVYTVAVRDENNVNYTTVFTGTFADLMMTDGVLSTAVISEFYAGTYRLTIVSADSASPANFVPASLLLDFVIERAENEWTQTPEVSLGENGWTYGDVAPATPVGITKYEYDAAGVTGVYWQADSNGTLTVQLSGVPANAGLYAFKTTASATTNYKELVYISYFEIKQFENGWKDEIEPEATLNWTWGDEISDSWRLLTAEPIMQANGAPTYVIRSADGNSDPIGAADIKKELALLGAGTYNVVITVAGSELNHTEISSTTSVTVNKATLEWGTAPSDTSWIWGAAGNFSAPVAVGVNGAAVNAVYRVSYTSADGNRSSTDSYDTVQSVQSAVVGGDAGRYEIFVSVENENYYSFSGMAVITITPAQNDWRDNSAPLSSLSRTYQQFTESLFQTPIAIYGNDSLRYECREGNTITQIDKELYLWLNEQDAGTYNVYSIIDGTNNYSLLETLTVIKVLEKSSSWDNESSLKLAYGYTYGTMFTITVPLMATIPDEASLKYTLTYNGKSLELPETVAELEQYFKTVRDAGEYQITAEYDSGDKNVESLSYTVTVTINREDIDWVNGTKPSTLVDYPYGGVTMAVPSAGAGHFVTYRIVTSGGELTPTIPEGSTIIDYLNTLDVGTYTLYCEISETTNYSGLAAETTIIITKAPNDWKVVDGVDTAPPSVLEWVRGEENTFVVPVAQHGTVKFTVNGTSPEDLIAYLNELSAGTYNLVSEVAADTNYVGFKAETRIEIIRQNNDWVSGTKLNDTYNLNWSTDGISLPTPQSVKNYGEEGNNLRFDIESFSESYSYKVQGMTKTQYENWLKTVVPAVYKVVFYVDETDDIDGVTGTSLITVNKIENKWTKSPAQDQINWIYGTSLSDIEFISLDGTPIFYIDGVIVNGSLSTALEGLSVGEHTVRAEVAESLYYRSLVGTVTLHITQGDNGWAEELLITGWTWDDVTELDWTAPKPLQGGVVTITVTMKQSGSDSEMFTYTLIYYTGENDTVTSNVEILESRLLALNAGTYEIRAEIPESVNWGGTFVDTATFTVSPNKNEWTNGVPVVEGWTYGSSRNLPSVNGVKYGNVEDIRYTYYLVTDGGDVEVNDFDRAGNYKFTAVLAASAEGNYSELRHSGTFVIARAETGWRAYPVISAWTWNEFNQDKNLFAGAAASGGKLTFDILDKKGNVVIGGLEPNENGVITDDAKLYDLKNLLAGEYKYVVHVAETENYNGTTTSAQTLTIGQATNRWLTYPRVTMWAENLWSTAQNMPEAAALYGEITITITDNNENEGDRIVYFRATYNADGTMKGTAEVNTLAYAEGGKYLLRGYVAADAERYSGLDDVMMIEIFLSSEARPVNHWTLYPKISSWTAGDAPVTDQAEAYRYTEIIKTYYRMINNVRVLVPEDEFDAHGYPTEPGKYLLTVVAIYEGYDFDTLEEEVEFEIYKRIIEWTVTPNIIDWQLSGEASKPVADFNFSAEDESTLTFAYKLSTQDDSEAVSALPTQPGDYVMIVTATAKYCDPQIARVDFKVTLSKNTWIDIPVIESWSEEFAPNTPTGRAQYGEVTYVYKAADGTVLDETPTEEGTYIMCATVEVEGYETLYAEYEFTVTAAFDTTLLTVDIVLASVLCALMVVVIIFAIRRYREC